MVDQVQQSALSIMREMGIDDAAIERRKKIVGLTPDDYKRIADAKEIIVPNVDRYTATFFDHLGGLEEARQLLATPAVLTRAKRLKREHLVELASGKYGAPYVEQRLELGLLYAKAGLDQRVFLGAFYQLTKAIGADIMKGAQSGSCDQQFETFISLQKVAFFDIGLISDVLAFERERIIHQQQEAIRELSTPVLQLKDRLLLLPLIGVIDTHRAKLITESVLKQIRATRAKVVVMDITGVGAIDSRVAHHILQTVAAARLMGAEIVVTGISSEVAQSLVALGIELSRLTTMVDLQGGLEEAERILANGAFRLAAARAAKA
jgi:rsbT co-antagonist protein RsbR